MIMRDTLRLLTSHPADLAREALGLAGICVVILAAFYLPVLA